MIRFLRNPAISSFFSFLLLTLFFCPVSSRGQAKFSVVCPQKKIGKNDQLQIKFKVENAQNVDDITPPDFKNFTIVSGPNQESSTSSINGKVSQYVALGYTLAPQSTGTFTIGSATAVADGQHLSTQPVTIRVVNGSIVQAQPNNGQQGLFPPLPNLNFDFAPASSGQQFNDYILKPGENIDEKTSKDLFIKLSLSRKSCYVGEPLVATYQLYSRLPSESTITDAPSFNGFSVNDLDISNDPHLEKWNGRLYNVYDIRRVELYPLQSGEITLGSMKASNKVTFVKSSYAGQQDDFFDMFQNFGQGAVPAEGLVVKNVTLQSTPETIMVKPLPEAGRPADFRGAVGQFTITASLEKNRITTDDAGNLKLDISGKGNIQLVNAPVINWPSGLDGFDAKVKDSVDKKQVPIQGSKTFSYPFTVSKPGNYTIDSIAFSYFDPVTSTYRTLHADPLSLEVTKGKGISHGLLSGSPAGSGPNALISTKTEIIAGLVLVVLIFLVFIIVLMKKNRNRDDLEKAIEVDDLENAAQMASARKEESLFSFPENPLSAPHEMLVAGDSAGFYRTLDGSLKNYLAAKFKVPAGELSKKRLNEELDKCNVSLGTLLMLNSLIDEVELNLYAPPSNAVQLNSVFEKAAEVVSLLDKQVC